MYFFRKNKENPTMLYPSIWHLFRQKILIPDQQSEENYSWMNMKWFKNQKNKEMLDRELAKQEEEML